MTPTLPRGAAEVWVLRVEASHGTADPERLDWLTADERARADRFRFARDRRLYVASRIMIRSLLSRYTGRDPGALRFEADGFGKPALSAPLDAAPTFSLSHTHGLVCCAVAADHAVGVDAESLDRAVDVAALASRCCSPLEQRDLERLGEAERRRRFLAYWTLKESLTKAIGCGLTIDLSRLSFQIDDGRIQVAFDRLDEGPADWRFGLFDSIGGYAIAVSLRGAGDAGTIQLRETSLSALQCVN